MNDHYLSQLAEKVNTHYLSLLTDEFRSVLNALIAARAEIAGLKAELEVARMPIQGYRALEAENKRKDEVIASLRAATHFAEHDELKETK